MRNYKKANGTRNRNCPSKILQFSAFQLRSHPLRGKIVIFRFGQSNFCAQARARLWSFQISHSAHLLFHPLFRCQQRSLFFWQASNAAFSTLAFVLPLRDNKTFRCYHATYRLGRFCNPLTPIRALSRRLSSLWVRFPANPDHFFRSTKVTNRRQIINRSCWRYKIIHTLIFSCFRLSLIHIT